LTSGKTAASAARWHVSSPVLSMPENRQGPNKNTWTKGRKSPCTNSHWRRLKQPLCENDGPYARVPLFSLGFWKNPSPQRLSMFPFLGDSANRVMGLHTAARNKCWPLTENGSENQEKPYQQGSEERQFRQLRHSQHLSNSLVKSGDDRTTWAMLPVFCC
jgi:hypothetical protein